MKETAKEVIRRMVVGLATRLKVTKTWNLTVDFDMIRNSILFSKFCAIDHLFRYDYNTFLLICWACERGGKRKKESKAQNKKSNLQHNIYN